MRPQRIAQESRLLDLASPSSNPHPIPNPNPNQESRLLDLVTQMADEAHDLVRHLQDWRRVAREQARARARARVGSGSGSG